MTKEEKQLLIIDLSARVFYGVKVNIERDFPNNPQIVERIAKDGEIIVNGNLAYDIYYYKPYLRPMSSMTKEEEKELVNFAAADMFASQNKNPWFQLAIRALCADFFNKHYFDYRTIPSTGKTLIESGLALEAPEGIYKT